MLLCKCHAMSQKRLLHSTIRFYDSEVGNPVFAL